MGNTDIHEYLTFTEVTLSLRINFEGMPKLKAKDVDGLEEPAPRRSSRRTAPKEDAAPNQPSKKAPAPKKLKKEPVVDGNEGEEDIESVGSYQISVGPRH